MVLRSSEHDRDFYRIEMGCGRPLDRDATVKILAIERDVPDAPADAFQPHLKAEAAQVWQLYQAGIIRELYFRQDRHNAVLVLECADEEEAARQLQSLPLVQAGLITFEIIPLVAYPGFARLFAETPSPHL